MLKKKKSSFLWFLKKKKKTKCETGTFTGRLKNLPPITENQSVRGPSHQPGPVIRQQLHPSICLWPNTQHSPQPAATQECSPVPASSCSARMSHPASSSQRLVTLQNPVQGSSPAGSLPRPHPPHSQLLAYLSRVYSSSSAHPATAGFRLQASKGQAPWWQDPIL